MLTNQRDFFPPMNDIIHLLKNSLAGRHEDMRSPSNVLFTILAQHYTVEEFIVWILEIIVKIIFIFIQDWKLKIFSKLSCK